MISSSSWIIFGIVALVVVVVVWKFWKKPSTNAQEVKTITNEKEKQPEPDTGPPPQDPSIDSSTFGQAPPPMVFAVNDDGNFDLADATGKVLNIGFGPTPKTYINLLDQSEKDISKMETGQMVSNVGTTKLYEIGGRPYIVNFTRL
jgi:hypothetical protein